MAVKFTKGKQTAIGMQVTDNQNDTVGIVVWAAANGHNLQQVASGASVIPAIPVDDNPLSSPMDSTPIPQWGWVLIDNHGVLWDYSSSEQLAEAGWKQVDDAGA